MDFGKHGAKRLGRKLGDFVKAAGRVIDGFAGGIIHRQPKVQPRALCRGGFGIRDGLAQRGGQAIAAPDDAEPHTFVDAVVRFCKKVLLQQTQDGLDFGSGTLPIRGGKREKRQCMNAHAGRSLDHAAGRLRSRAMTCGARQTSRSGPSAIAVRDDGDVQPRGLGDGRR